MNHPPYTETTHQLCLLRDEAYRVAGMYDDLVRDAMAAEDAQVTADLDAWFSRRGWEAAALEDQREHDLAGEGF